MKQVIGVVAMLGVGVFSTGCATKKYVRNTVTPVDQRVSELDKKTADQLSSQGKNLEEVGTDLSRTKERLTDTDARARAAGDAASKADAKAGQAATAADQARQTAEKGLQETASLGKRMESMMTYKMLTNQTIQFGPNKRTLDDAAKATLDEMVKQVGNANRFVIEVQGFADASGPKAYNLALSEDRAQAVARYLTIEHKVPLRNIHVLGAGTEGAVADNKTRAGRKQNRRVELRVWVPEADVANKPVTTDNE
jgi:outer membrane protein OmpA-like peptidoglycan-associated protein